MDAFVCLENETNVFLMPSTSMHIKMFIFLRDNFSGPDSAPTNSQSGGMRMFDNL